MGSRRRFKSTHEEEYFCLTPPKLKNEYINKTCQGTTNSKLGFKKNDLFATPVLQGTQHYKSEKNGKTTAYVTQCGDDKKHQTDGVEAEKENHFSEILIRSDSSRLPPIDENSPQLDTPTFLNMSKLKSHGSDTDFQNLQLSDEKSANEAPLPFSLDKKELNEKSQMNEKKKTTLNCCDRLISLPRSAFPNNDNKLSFVNQRVKQESRNSDPNYHYDSRISTGRDTSSPRHSQFSTRTSSRFAAGDRKTLVGGRFLSSSSVFTPRSRHGVVLLRSPKTTDDKSSFDLRLVVLGGEVTNANDKSCYFECDWTIDDLLKGVPFAWRMTELIPPIEHLSSHTMNSLSANDSDKFIVFGGSHSYSLFGTLYVIDGSSRKSYASTTTGQQPANRSEHSTVIIDTNVYIFGGRPKPVILQNETTQSVRASNAARFADALQQPQKKDSDPKKKLVHCCSGTRSPVTSSKPREHLFQQFVEPCKVFRDMWKIDLRHFEWERISLKPELTVKKSDFSETKRWSEPDSPSFRSAIDRLPRGRAGHSAVIWNGGHFIFGGFDGEVVVEDFWCFDLITRKWTQLYAKGKSPGCRYGAASCLIGDQWFIHGGITDSSMGILNDFYIFDFATFCGSRVRVDVHWDPPRLLPSLAFHSIAAISLHQNGKCGMLLIGGYGKFGQHCNAIYFVMKREDVLEISMNSSAPDQFPYFAPCLRSFHYHESGLGQMVNSRQIIGKGIKQNDDLHNDAMRLSQVEKPNLNQGQINRCVNSSKLITNDHPSKECQEESIVSLMNCESCQSILSDNSALKKQIEYLSNRLYEQKYENLQLRTLTKETTYLRQKLLSREIQLKEFDIAIQHYLVGPIIRTCLKVLCDENGKDDNSKLLEIVKDSNLCEASSQRCIKCLKWMKSTCQDPLLCPNCYNVPTIRSLDDCED